VAAAALASVLEKERLDFEIIKIIHPDGPTLVSDSLGIQVSHNGFHVGILHNGFAHCSIHPGGKPLGMWLNDFVTLAPGYLPAVVILTHHHHLKIRQSVLDDPCCN